MPELAARLRPWGAAAAFASALLNLVWLGAVIYLIGVGDTAAQVREHPGIFRLSVGACLVLTMLQLPLLAALASAAAKKDPARAVIGGAFYLIYIPLNLIAYFSFGRLAPIVYSFLDRTSSLLSIDGQVAARSLARSIEIGDPMALTGNLPVLGYGLLGIAWLVLGTALWRRSRWWSVAVVLMMISGTLSVAGAAGSFFELSWLASATFAGGVFSLPALILVFFAFLRDSRAS